MVQDDRTPEQKASLNWLVVGTDSFLSGWGQAKGGSSYAAWACRDHKHAERVAEWVKGRSDMKRVRIVKEPYRPGSRVHLHIYIGSDCHPEGPKLRPINPPPQFGLKVQCVVCHYMWSAATVMADLNADPNTFVCSKCLPRYIENRPGKE